MSLFFESIQIKDRKALNLEDHQDRVNHTLNYLNSEQTIDLRDYISTLELPENGVFKLRISYNLNEITNHKITPYLERNKFKSITLVLNDSIDYQLKYEDRSTINQLKNKSNADEIIIVKNRLLTDSSISNIALLKNKIWYTPRTPLLKGTQRTLLLRQELLKLKDIHVDDIKSYSHLCFFNALNTFESAIHYPVKEIFKF